MNRPRRVGVFSEIRINQAKRRGEITEMSRRDYSHLIKRLKSLNWHYMHIETAGSSVKGYPIYKVKLRGNTKNQRRVLLSAGIHGDEPAGVETILRFLEQDNSHLLQSFEFLVMPCINPYGYVYDTRENSEGIDVNRAFEDNSAVEAVIVKKALQEKCFELFIDFHEDWEYSGFYLYEKCRHGELIGSEIIRNVKKIGTIHKGKMVDDFPVSNGLVSPDLDAEDFGYEAMAVYIYKFHSEHIITCETPTNWDMEQRVNVHLVTLDSALMHYLLLH